MTRLIVLLLLFCPASLAARDSTYQLIRHYTDVNGLPQNSIKEIAQDDAGFWWLATEAGLARFDGHRFNLFNASTLGIRTNRFSRIFIPWNTSGLYAVSDEGDYILLKAGKAVLQQGKNHASILKELSPKSSYQHLLDIAGDLTPSNVVAALADEKAVFIANVNDLYLTDRRYITLYHSGKLSYQIPRPDKGTGTVFLLNDHLYCLSVTGILYKLHMSGDSFHSWEKTWQAPVNKKHPPTKWKAHANFNHRDEIIFSNNDDWYLVEDKNGRLTSKKMLSQFSIKEAETLCAWVDSGKGLLLIGSQTQGLFFFSIPHFRTILPDRENGVHYAQAKITADSLLTPQGWLISTVTGEGHRLKNWSASLSDKYSLVTDRQGIIWSIKNDTLSRITRSGLTVNSQRWVLNTQISTLSKSVSGELWLGATTGIVYLVNEQNPPPGRICFRLASAVTHIEDTETSMVWAGTAKGLYRCNKITGEIALVEGSANLRIRSILTEDSNTTWITTYESGLYIYRSGRLLPLPSDRHGHLSSAHCVIPDNYGFLWISSNSGLFRIARKNLLAFADKQTSEIYYQRFSVNEGLTTNEFNGGCEPCGLKLSDSLLSFPSIQGLVWVNPQHFAEQDMALSPLILDHVFIDNKEVSIDALRSLPPTLRQLRFELALSYTGDPDDLQLAYALVKGKQDTVWLPVNDQLITLSTLPPGEHHLLIRRHTRLGIDNFIIESFKLSIPFPWYTHPFFIGLFTILSMAIIFGLGRLRTRYILKRNRELKTYADNQTAELAHALQELKESELRLMAQSDWQQKMVAILGHDIKAPLRYLTFTSQMLSEQLKQAGHYEFESPMQSVTNYTQRLYYGIENMLHYIKLQLNERKITWTQVALPALVQEKILLFLPLAKATATTIKCSIDSHHTVLSDEQLLSVIIHNIVDNAIKVTPHGFIQISGKELPDYYELSFADTGMGMEADIMNWLNTPVSERFQSVGVKEPTQGLGLRIVRELCWRLGILLKATTSSEGTTICLCFPPKSAVGK